MFRPLSSLTSLYACLHSHLVGMKHATARDFRITDGVLHEAMAAADADDGEEESQKKAKKRNKVLPESRQFHSRCQKDKQHKDQPDDAADAE